MPRITIADAHIAATEIVKSIEKDINDIDLKIKDTITEMFKKQIPKEVLEFAKNKKLNDFLHWTHSVYIGGVGVKNQRLYFNNDVYLPHHSDNITLNSHDSLVISKLLNEKETLEEKKKRDYETIKNTVLSLGSYNKCKEVFPEAFKYLPVGNNHTGLMIPLAPVKKLLQQLTKNVT